MPRPPLLWGETSRKLQLISGHQVVYKPLSSRLVVYHFCYFVPNLLIATTTLWTSDDHRPWSTINQSTESVCTEMETTYLYELLESTKKIILLDDKGHESTLQVSMKVLERINLHENGQSYLGNKSDSWNDGQIACLTHVQWIEWPKVIWFHPSLGQVSQ